MDARDVQALVGRARELAEVDAALDRLATGRPWLVQIVGEPGIGKSRLLAELCRRGEDRGYLVLDGRAAEFEHDIPFGLIIDALNDYLASVEPPVLRTLEEEDLEELASVFPSLPRPDRHVASRGEGAQRYRLHYAIRRVLERLTSRQPMMLALDDVHWADAASVEVLAHLLRRFRGPLLTAVAYRPTPTRLLAALEAAAQGGMATRLDLAPLGAEDAGTLFTADVDDATRTLVFRESGGNPFYIEQLIRSSHGRPVRLRHGPGRSGTTVPRAVTAAIQDELHAASAESRLTLQAAAVAGEPFEPELVGAIAEQPVSAVLGALDELLEFDFIRSTDVPRRFRFRHPIVRRAVYDGMPMGWRIGAHARAADALAAARAPAGVRAHHVEGSASVGDEQAIELLVQAGRDAAPRAPEAAGRWLLGATRLLPLEGDEERHLSLLAEAADALTCAGAYEASLEVLDEASRRLAGDQAGERATLVARIAFAKRMGGRPLESRDLVERAREALAPASEQALALTLELAQDHYWRGEFAEMHEVAREVSDWAGGADLRLFAAWGAALCSVASTSLDRFADGSAELRDAAAIAGTLTDEELAEHIDVAGYIAQAASLLERTDEALEYACRGLRLAESTGQSPFIPGLLVVEANALVMQGRITEALAVAETATDAAVLTGNDQFAVWALWADSMVCSAAGDTVCALAGAREAAARSASMGQTFFSSLSRLHLAAALTAAGDAAGARQELTAFEAGPTQRLLDLRGGHGWDLLIRTQLSLGDAQAAAESAATAEARARATPLPQRAATAACGQAAVLLDRGEDAAALAAARDAIRFADAGRNPVLSARARAFAGAALGRLGRSVEAVSELESAERTLLEFGALREAESVGSELRRLGRRRPRRFRTTSGTGAMAALSPRELEVATLVALGSRNRDVAAALFLSEKTVESHLARIYDKLGVRSRAALATLIAGGSLGGERPGAAMAGRPD